MDSLAFSILKTVLIAVVALTLLSAAAIAASHFSVRRRRSILGHTGALDHPAAELWRRRAVFFDNFSRIVGSIGTAPLLFFAMAVAAVVLAIGLALSRIGLFGKSKPQDSVDFSEYVREDEQNLEEIERLREFQDDPVPVEKAVAGTSLIISIEGPGKFMEQTLVTRIDRVDATGRWLYISGTVFDRLTGLPDSLDPETRHQSWILLPADKENLDAAEEHLRRQIRLWRSEADDPTETSGDHSP